MTKFKSPKSILVTGCAGFIGANFVRAVEKEFPNTEIIGIDNLSTGRSDALSKSLTFYKASILDTKTLNKIFEKHKPEYVFHFAALPRVSYSVAHPTETSENNIVSTVALLEASKNVGVKRFIYSSSSSVYGGAKNLPTKESENLPNPKSPYAIQKYIGEPFCRVFSQIFGIETVCLRYFNVFGPGQYGDNAYASVISSWLEHLYFPKNSLPFLEGDGKQTRDFCFVDNVVEANILAMKSEKKLMGEAMNIGCGERISIKNTQKLVEKLSGKKLVLEKRPTRPGDVRDSLADISLAKKLLGYNPKIRFEEGLRRTIQWFESRKK